MAFDEFAVRDFSVGLGVFREWEFRLGANIEDESENEKEDEWGAHGEHNESALGGFANKITIVASWAAARGLHGCLQSVVSRVHSHCLTRIACFI